MAYAGMASRLKLIGLLLICTSVIMFLVLSACGVDSVHINTPLAQRLATEWQLTSSRTEAVAAEPTSAVDTFLTAMPAFDPQPQYAANPSGSQILPPGYSPDPYALGPSAVGRPAGYGGQPSYATPATTPYFAAGDFGLPPANQALATTDQAVQTAASAVGLRIPLWCIIAVFLFIGFVLWSMPQPRASAYAAGRRR